MTTLTRAQKARLGLFLAVGFTLLFGAIFLMVGSSLLEVRDRYLIRFEGSVSGLSAGSGVRYNGVPIGRVESIEIDRRDVGGVLVTVSLKEGTPIKDDTVAVLEMQGITGLKYIELTGGTNEGRTLKEGEVIQSSASTLDLLTGRATSIAAKIEDLIDNLKDLTGGDTGDRIRATIDDVRGAVSSFRKILDSAAPDVDSLGRKAGGLVDDIQLAVRELTTTLRSFRDDVSRIARWVNPKDVDKIVASVNGVLGEARKRLGSEEFGAAMMSVKKLADRTEQTVSHVDLTLLQMRDDLMKAIEDFMDGAEAFAEFAGVLRDNPSALLTGRTEKQRELP